MSRWKNRCRAYVHAEVNGRLLPIDRCALELGHDRPHWSKDSGEDGPWVVRELDPESPEFLKPFTAVEIPGGSQ